MDEKILFQQDQLTVTDKQVKVGPTALYYPSISGVTIYDGRPMRPMGFFLGVIAGFSLLGCIGVLFLTQKLSGPSLSTFFLQHPWLIALLVAFATGVFFYVQHLVKFEVRYLSVFVGSESIPVLKSADRADLERAKP